MRTDGLQTEGAVVGRTLGVEEEFHLVDPATMEMTPGPRASAAALAGDAGERVHPEIATTQLEIATGICTSLEQVRAELVAARREAAAAAERDGLLLLPASTHPWNSWHTMPVTPGERYEAMVDRWAGLARQQDICGCHVHVGIPDLDTAVAVLDRTRPYIPVLLAMTCSSPFHDGVDTGYESWRTLWWTRFPHAGAPEPLGDADGYRRVLAGLVASGVVADGSHLYWDVRPSARLPTIEFRLADVCTTVDDTVLHAALVRSLVRVLAVRAQRGEPVPELRPELLRAARWRAARSGLTGPLFDPLRAELVGPREAVGALLAELEEDLIEAGEWDEVTARVQDLLGRGTSAARQRSTWLRTGDRRAVAEWVVREGAAGRS
ncbi:carboxylate-amine ligase [Geodermatophilus amargosae]|uniref:Putative glutamate--cysteine ligase 2 n=1 Tax=Geodermatophilus amargosae TaxID=1296565 RepID=A0A1I6ZTW5_9ACTN|nr:glutamate--cysteine ligase [Geodermatophilus amargosae]SFT66128.1 carboxylate-amine ligase [Geodermatophilus amargosae]